MLTRWRTAIDRRVGGLHMEWHHVLFANWPVDPAVVRPHIPDALTLDTHDGEAWLSVVPFTNRDVRPVWAPGGTGLPLPELNLRTYVTADDHPGVYFFSLDARGLLSVTGARLFHHLPYYYARTSLTTDGDRVSFASRRCHPGARPLHFRARYEPVGERFTDDRRPLDRFLTRRHRYYTEDAAGRLRFAAVYHDPWPLYEAEASIADNDVFSANGFDRPASTPVYLYSPRVVTTATGSHLVGPE